MILKGRKDPTTMARLRSVLYLKWFSLSLVDNNYFKRKLKYFWYCKITSDASETKYFRVNVKSVKNKLKYIKFLKEKEEYSLIPANR